MPVTNSPVLLVQRRCTSGEEEMTFFSIKKETNLQIFFSENDYYFLLYTVCIAQLLKG
jgi:hypothetical protein